MRPLPKPGDLVTAVSLWEAWASCMRTGAGEIFHLNILRGEPLKARRVREARSAEAA